MPWTPEQLQAITHRDGRLAVVAGAGSGKTGVLTERFVHLVHKHGVDPERILTLTFTRTAAAEMKTRIVLKLERLGLSEARQRIENAYIHTVHALCRRLLQENPFEAGIEPEPRVLPPPAARQLSREAFHTALQEQLNSLDDELKQALTDLIGNHLSLTSARRDPLEELFQVVRTVAETACHQGLTLEDLQEWELSFPTNPLEPVSRCLPISQTLDPSNITVETLSTALQDALQRASCLEQANEIQSLLGKVAAVEPEAEARAHRIAHALLRLTLTYLRHYDQLKDRLGVLNFDDMPIRALKLLRESATVRHRYQRLFQYVLVDETQDIDPLQAQIIELLSQNGNLMVVGDSQQSIYGFRYADPRVFQAWQRSAQADHNGKVIALQANFRSHPDILAFVEKVLQPKWGMHLMRLQPQRQFAREGGARVQVWYRKKTDARAEAHQIASTLREWVQRGSLQVHDPETGERRPAQYGDFALLFKQYTRVEQYEQAFAEQGVPYFVVGGGRGYWLQYEVRDLANLMRILSDSQDEIALLSVLRSPLVGLSLDALLSLIISAQTRELPLISIVLEADDPELGPKDAERLVRFVGWFEPLRQQVGYRSVGWLLARALEYSAYEAKLKGMPHGHQKVANVRKLLALALDQPNLTPAQFAEQLEMMSRTEQREGHAPTFEENANIVRFYTVHGAKGLEFPVVFLVDTAFRPRSEPQPVMVAPQARLIGLRVRASDQAEPYTPLLYELLKAERDQREEQELLRMLYVALTRARDYLIVALTHSQGNAWSLTLAGALADALNRQQTRFPLPNGSYGELVYCSE